MAHHGNSFRLGPRVPIFKVEEETPVLRPSEENVLDLTSLPPSRVMPRVAITSDPANSATCLAGTADLCEKPTSSAALTVPIVLGVAIPLVIAIGVLVYLHRRSTLRMRKEDIDDPHKSLDFGMGEGKKRKSGFFGGGKEKESRHRHQLSMDVDMSSPYLLPPQMQESRDSLHSLAKSLKKDGDPYGPVDDVSSIRSSRPGLARKNTDGLSVYTTSSGHGSTRNGPFNKAPRHNSIPHSLTSVPGSPLTASPARGNPFDSRPISEDALPAMPSPPAPAVLSPSHAPTQTGRHPAQGPMAIQEDKMDPTTSKSAAVEEPEPTARSLPSPLPIDGAGRDDGFDFGLDNDRAGYQHHDASYYDEEPQGKDRSSQRQSPQDLGLLDPPGPSSVPLPKRKASLPSESRSSPPKDKEYAPFAPEIHEEHYEEEEYPDRGRHPSRRSNVRDHDGGLHVPAQGNKRMSVGVRPLPPIEVMETEDPEKRAERIRSFYREYFDEWKRDSVIPPMPNMPLQSNRHAQGTDYYEDYDQNYLGETVFFNPESNAFVMPYAEPVTRRAMTPPPRGRVPVGPGRGHRPHVGSVGGMSLPGGGGRPRPHPRSGSAMSGRFRGPPSIPGSAPGSRAGSRAPMNRKAIPPPAVLNTLPTPSKLKDDSVALLGSIDFAPPETFAERAAGRSQSPVGERRPYQLKVPISSPLANTHDEMAVLPSPHSLRKSGTFTGLDFAPPKRFKDAELMSDGGSIRSNRSGISAVSSQALRSGAGRISKLPGDTVFTQADTNQQLKPQWGMRP